MRRALVAGVVAVSACAGVAVGYAWRAHQDAGDETRARAYTDVLLRECGRPCAFVGLEHVDASLWRVRATPDGRPRCVLLDVESFEVRADGSFAGVVQTLC